MNLSEQKAYREGYAAGFKAATLLNGTPHADAALIERRRIVSLLKNAQLVRETIEIQKVIDLIEQND